MTVTPDLAAVRRRAQGKRARVVTKPLPESLLGETEAIKRSFESGPGIALIHGIAVGRQGGLADFALRRGGGVSLGRGANAVAPPMYAQLKSFTE